MRITLVMVLTTGFFLLLNTTFLLTTPPAKIATNAEVKLTVSPNSTVEVQSPMNVTCGVSVLGAAKEVTLTFLIRNGEESKIQWIRDEKGKWNRDKKESRKESKQGPFSLVIRGPAAEGNCIQANLDLRVCSGPGDALTAIFYPSPWFRGIKCSATLMNSEKLVPEITPLNITWKPKIINFGSPDRQPTAMSRITLYCTAILGSDEAVTPLINGRKSAIVLAITDKLGYLTVETKLSMIVTAEDHGRELNCSIGESMKTTRLQVWHSPTFFLILPNDNTTVFPGQSIACVVKSFPPVPMELNIRGVRSLGNFKKTLLATKSGRAVFKMPLSAEPGFYSVRCTTNGVERLRRKIQLIKPPFPITFDFRSSIAISGEARRLVCAPNGTDWTEIVLGFRRRRLRIRRTFGDSVTQLTTDSLTAELAWLPQEVFDVRIEEAGNSSIVVSFRPDDSYNGTEVWCGVISKFNMGRMEVKLFIVRKPSVLRLTVRDKERNSTVARKGEDAIASCEVDLGGPAVPLSTVRGTIDGQQLTAPSYWIFQNDRRNLRHEVRWRLRFPNQNDSRSVVECRIGDSVQGVEVRLLEE